MNAEWIWVFNIVAVWYFILSSNVITLYDQTWLISVNISRLLRKCFLFLFLFWWRRSYTFIWDLSLLLFCWQCTFSASNTCFFSARVVSTLGKLNWTIQRPTVWSPYHTILMNFVIAEAISLERERRKKCVTQPEFSLIRDWFVSSENRVIQE